MLKKLVVPFFTLTIAALGCSSSSSPNPGTGGNGGTAAGGSGGSAAGGSGGAATGGSGGAATGGSGGAPGDAAVSMSDCDVTDSVGTDKLTATVFCQNLLAFCSDVPTFTLPTDYATENACEATFNASSQQHCQSYHLCWGVEGLTNTAPANPKVHCFHAVGMNGFCMPDASTGN